MLGKRANNLSNLNFCDGENKIITDLNQYKHLVKVDKLSPLLDPELEFEEAIQKNLDEYK